MALLMKEHAKYQTRCRRTAFFENGEGPDLREVGFANCQIS
jgi:hypothetical protein